MNVSIRTEGRRHYLIGDTYPYRAEIKAAGCNWDASAKAWWTGVRKVAEDLVAVLPTVVGGSGGQRAEGPGLRTLVKGKAEYKGRHYPFVTTWYGVKDGAQVARVLLV